MLALGLVAGLSGRTVPAQPANPAVPTDLAGRPLESADFDRLLPPEERALVFLPSDPLQPVSRDSTSRGTVSEGRLQDAQQLPLIGPHHAVLQEHRGRRGLHWGTAELLELVRYAAAHVAARHPGAVLGVGNLSRRRGGDSPYSVSHNSGRDVDLAFYMVQGEEGTPFVPRTYLHLGSDGRVRGASSPAAARLDVARTWALVEALITHPVIDIQWLYISDPLRDLLLRHARETGVDPLLRERAARVLAQPLASGSHDDHLHVRIFCSPDDIFDGCRDTEPRWPWVERYEDIFALRLGALIRLAREESGGRRYEALQRLADLGAPEAAPQLVTLLDSENPRLRSEVARVVGLLGNPDVAAPLIRRLAGETRPEVQAELCLALGALGSREAVVPLLDLLREQADLPIRVAGAAVQALGQLQAEEAVPALADLLSSGDVELRETTARVLQELAGSAFEPPSWWRNSTPMQRERVVARWQRWWQDHALQPREQWLAEGFAQAGYPITFPLQLSDVRSLIAARQDPRLYLRVNAEQLLRTLAEEQRWRPGEDLRSARFWKDWWRRARQQGRFAG